VGFFNKKTSTRDTYKEKYAEEISHAYDAGMKKKLVADAKKQASYDALTKKEKFRVGVKKFKAGKKRFDKFKSRRPLETRSKPFEP